MRSAADDLAGYDHLVVIQDLLISLETGRDAEVSTILSRPHIKSLIKQGLAHPVWAKDIIKQLSNFLAIKDPAITSIFDQYFQQKSGHAKKLFRQYLMIGDFPVVEYLERLLKDNQAFLKDAAKKVLDDLSSSSSSPDSRNHHESVERYLLNKEYGRKAFDFPALMKEWDKHEFIHSDHPMVKVLIKDKDDPKIISDDAAVVFIALATLLTDWGRAQKGNKFFRYVEWASPMLVKLLADFLVRQKEVVLSELLNVNIPTGVNKIVYTYLPETSAYQEITNLVKLEYFKMVSPNPFDRERPMNASHSLVEYCAGQDVIIRDLTQDTFVTSGKDEKHSAEYVPLNWTDEEILYYGQEALKRTRDIEFNVGILQDENTGHSPRLFSQSGESKSAAPERLDAFIYRDIFCVVNKNSRTIFCFSYFKDHPVILDIIKQRVQALHCKDFQLKWLSTAKQDCSSKSLYTALNFFGLALHCAGQRDCAGYPFNIRELDSEVCYLPAKEPDNLIELATQLTQEFATYQLTDRLSPK